MMEERRRMRIELSQGAVEIFYPGELAADDLDDWQETMAILFRSLRRSLENVAVEEKC